MKIPHTHLARVVLSLTGASLVLVLLVASGAYVARHRQAGTEEVFVEVAPSASPTVLANVVPVAPSATPSALAATTSETASTAVANFYAAYRAKDRARLGSLFTPDAADALKNLHATLFTGKDTQGNVVADSPTLFLSSNVLEFASDYTILGTASQAKNWVVTVREIRQNSAGNQHTATSLITLVPSTTGENQLLIDSYIQTGGKAKYDGFFTQ
jgi:hypothetical protein